MTARPPRRWRMHRHRHPDPAVAHRDAERQWEIPGSPRPAPICRMSAGNGLYIDHAYSDGVAMSHKAGCSVRPCSQGAACQPGTLHTASAMTDREKDACARTHRSPTQRGVIATRRSHPGPLEHHGQNGTTGQPVHPDAAPLRQQYHQCDRRQAPRKLPRRCPCFEQDATDHECGKYLPKGQWPVPSTASPSLYWSPRLRQRSETKCTLPSLRRTKCLHPDRTHFSYSI